MKFNSKNSFKSLDTISSSGKSYKIFNLKIAEKNGQVDALKVIVPASMTLSELEIATAEKIASECVSNSYVSCPS